MTKQAADLPRRAHDEVGEDATANMHVAKKEDRDENCTDHQRHHVCERAAHQWVRNPSKANGCAVDARQDDPPRTFPHASIIARIGGQRSN